MELGQRAERAESDLFGSRSTEDALRARMTQLDAEVGVEVRVRLSLC